MSRFAAQPVYFSRSAFVLAVILVTSLLPAAPAAAQSGPAREIRLHVDTPAYTLEGGTLAVADYSALDVPGAPSLPMWGQIVELPADVEWSITYTATGEQTVPLSAPLDAVPVADLDLNSPYGALAQDVPDALPVVDRPDPAIYGQDAFYPASLAQAGPEGVRRGQRLLPVRVFPFQYNPARGVLRYYPHIEVVIRLTDGASVPAPHRPAPSPVPEAREGVAANASGGEVASASRDGLRIRTGERGLYRLSYADLSAAGVPVDTGNPAAFAVSYLNQPVDIEIVGGADGHFDPGDLVVFYAEPYAGRYQTQNVYRFTWDDPDPRRMQTRAVSPAPATAPVSVITQTLHVEVDAAYYSTYHLPRNADHIFDNSLYVNLDAGLLASPKSYALAFDDLQPIGSAMVRAQVHGGADQLVSPDQSLNLALNGHDLGTYQWDGSVSHLIQVAAPSAWLVDTPAGAASQLTLQTALAQLPALTEYWVSPDWVEVSYPAKADAEGDRLYIEGQSPPQPLAPVSYRWYLPMAGRGGHVQPSSPQRTVATGFTSSGVLAYDVTDVRRPVRLTGAAVTASSGSYALRFDDTTSTRPTYYLAATGGLQAPIAIEPDAGSTLRSPAHQADYIAIVHRSLWDAVQPLLDHRAAEGMAVAKVDVQDIYDEWSGGRLDPEAIRAFLSYAYHNWNGGGTPPTYVLLVGDGNFDFKGTLQLQLKLPVLPVLVPPYLIDVDPEIGETAADNRYVSVDGPDDFLADMEIGRIPAKTPAEVTAVVNKILAYEGASGGDWQKRAVFVADGIDDPAGFHALSELARLSLPPLYASSTIYYQKDAATDTAAEMRAAIRAAFDQGAFYLQWFGHASRATWSNANVFDILEPAKFQQNTDASWPFTASYSCWSGYFISIPTSPHSIYSEQTVAEALLLAPGRGSIADFSPTGLHVGSALQKLNQGLVNAMFQDRIDRAGMVVRDAKEYFFGHASAALDLIDTQMLFGDPATRLRLP